VIWSHHGRLCSVVSKVHTSADRLLCYNSPSTVIHRVRFPSTVSRLFKPFAWPLVTPPSPFLFKVSLGMELPFDDCFSRGLFHFFYARNTKRTPNRKMNLLEKIIQCRFRISFSLHKYPKKYFTF